MIKLTVFCKCFLLLSFSFYAFFSTSYAATIRTVNKNQQAIDQVLAEFKENLNIGILVQDIDSGATVYSKNADRYFVPASNQKLLTAFAALNYLNPNFSYQTRLFVDLTKMNNGVLNDHVYLQFTGDPTLSSAQFEKLIEQLSLANIKKISGNIIIDDTAFDDTAMSPGTTWDDKHYCFGAPLNTIILDHNCVSFTLTPTSPNAPVTLTPAEGQQFMFFVNNVVTAAADQECRINVKLLNDTTYHLSGCMRLNETPKTIWLAIGNPRINMQQVLFSLLKKHQIDFSGTIKFQKINKPLKLFSSVASPNVTVLINTMLKDSDNTIANALFKTIGAFYMQGAGDWQNGSFAIRSILSKTIHLDIPKTTLIDGAGISRYNYLTPKQLLTLLRQVYYSNNATWFLSSLPISGVDGTLKNWMTAESLRGKIRAKTGSETGVASLAGYLQTKQKKTFAFAILINGFVDAPTKYRSLEERICTTLIENN